MGATLLDHGSSTLGHLPHPPRLAKGGSVSDILVERDGPIATVVFNRPKLRNAISVAMWTEIARVSQALAEDDTVRAVV